MGRAAQRAEKLRRQLAARGGAGAAPAPDVVQADVQVDGRFGVICGWASPGS